MKEIINDENLPFLLELIKRELDPIKVFIDNLKEDQIVLHDLEDSSGNPIVSSNDEKIEGKIVFTIK